MTPRWWVGVLVLAAAGCEDRGAPAVAPPPAPAAPSAPSAAIDAAPAPPPVDAAIVDAPADAAAVDAARPRRRTPSKAELRKKCLDECDRRNMYTDCADENGMTACPCHCP